MRTPLTLEQDRIASIDDQRLTRILWAGHRPCSLDASNPGPEREALHVLQHELANGWRVTHDRHLDLPPAVARKPSVVVNIRVVLRLGLGREDQHFLLAVPERVERPHLHDLFAPVPTAIVASDLA